MFGILSPSGQFQGIGSLFQGQILPQFLPVFLPLSRRRECCSAAPATATVRVVVTSGTFVFDAPIAAASWTIDHPFVGDFPSVTVTDTAGNVVLADVQYIAGLDRVIVTFAQPFAGVAYLNA